MARTALEIRYSPVFPLFLTPGAASPLPASLDSVSFFFCPRPFYALGQLKPELSLVERDALFFTQGLASLLLVGLRLSRARELLQVIQAPQFEYWPLKNGLLDQRDVVSESFVNPPQEDPGLRFSPTGLPELDVYIEQIVASITTLWHAYRLHSPEEHPTLSAYIQVLRDLVSRYLDSGTSDPRTDAQRKNAIISALVELSAALSYAVTQGSSGSSPILASRSPFPHHSLLGVGGSLRALTKFTRYLESAFKRRSASQIILREYPQRRLSIPRLSMYDSGPSYETNTNPESADEFDLGGEFADRVAVPLLTQFSLRHGYKESKFSVTAASESLTVETLPQWTLLTLSHEIMHARVRDIFQALFGTTWDEELALGPWPRLFKDFANWYETPPPSPPLPADQALRILVLNFCCAASRWRGALNSHNNSTDFSIRGPEDLLRHYRENKLFAIELFVHFHDYYFAYACQPKFYIMSIWASWTRVAAPYLRPTEYLVRTLATVAAGSGLTCRAAFDSAADDLIEALEALEAQGFKSPLFDELRALLGPNDRETIFVLFKAACYLLDHVRKYFSSRIIARGIDRLEADPFSEGSPDAEAYSANIYAVGDPGSTEFISPIRFGLAADACELKGEPLDIDSQWLTAWQSIVIGSQEVKSC